MAGGARGKVRVGLFATCLVDLMRPSVGFAAAKLLEDAGCTVEVPVQTCCGQPAFNSGDRRTAQDLAIRVIDAFSGYDYVVAPSGSCAGQIRKHFPELFSDDPNWALIRLVFASPAVIAMIQVQDALGLGSEGRMNQPGSVGAWGWKLGELPSADTAKRLRAASEEAGRIAT